MMSRLPPTSRISLTKTPCGRRVEYAGLLERGERIGRQHFGPLVAVVAGRIATAEDVRERMRQAVVIRVPEQRHLVPNFGQRLKNAR